MEPGRDQLRNVHAVAYLNSNLIKKGGQKSEAESCSVHFMDWSHDVRAQIAVYFFSRMRKKDCQRRSRIAQRLTVRPGQTPVHTGDGWGG